MELTRKTMEYVDTKTDLLTKLEERGLNPITFLDIVVEESFSDSTEDYIERINKRMPEYWPERASNVQPEA